jgi:hypothetical protein
MLRSRLVTLLIGAIVGASSVAFVSYASSTGGVEISACANKKTGVLRILTKGKCTKNETTMRWNQTGPQGATGQTGAPGVPGSTGPAGSNARTVRVIDATGKDLGPLIDADAGISFLGSDGLIWTVNPSSGNFISQEAFYFLDASCSDNNVVTSLPYGNTVHGFNHLNAFGLRDPETEEIMGIYKLTGSKIDPLTTNLYAKSRNTQTGVFFCRAFDLDPNGVYGDYDPQQFYSRVTPISSPTFTVPLRLVEQ